jgi:hypothetical protein
MLYDFGEVIFCVGPVFLVIFIVFGALVWNSLPARKSKKESGQVEND